MRLFATLVLMIGQAVGGTQQPRWTAPTTVLTWVDPTDAPTDADRLVERALAVWTGATGGALTLRRTTAKANARMRVRFARDPGLYGETRPRIDPRTGAIVGADVVIATGTGGDDPLNARIVIYLTALHEIGHGIGLRHTDNFADIMYSFRRPDDGERYFAAFRRKLRSPGDIGSPQASGLSEHDLAAVRALYSR
jgi:matrixin